MVGQRVQEIGGSAHRPATDLDQTVPSGRRRRAPTSAVAAVAVCVLIAGSIGVVASRRSFEPNSDVDRTAVSAIADEGPTIEAGRMATTIGWLDGLSSGRILPTDVTARLSPHHPRVATAVLTAWIDLRTASGGRGMAEVMRWVDGLATGLILPTDVAARLANHDPRTARVVTMVWEDVKRSS
jgi:hypothetical protein